MFVGNHNEAHIFAQGAGSVTNGPAVQPIGKNLMMDRSDMLMYLKMLLMMKVLMKGEKETLLASLNQLLYVLLPLINP